MLKGSIKNFSWDFYSKLIILIYSSLQIMRLPILPQFMDIYYHILTAWGFIKAGGYTGWDFWQYAPLGRIHIYPPVFHLILTLPMKLGASPVILAKFFEGVMPVAFLVVLWDFAKKNYNDCLAFFVTLMFSSSFSFYLSLLNHLPATLAFIFGLLAFTQLFQRNFLRSLILLTLCFYTHIGISWFFALSFLFYGLFNREQRKICFGLFILALVLSIPILFKQLTSLRVISSLGLSLNERYLCQIKIVDYVLAFLGLILAFKKDIKYRLFPSFFLASLIFLVYPYRFFSAEGYLAVIALSALFLYALYQDCKIKAVYLKYILISVTLFILFFSPTVSMYKPIGKGKLSYKIIFFDSALMGMLFARGQTMWFPDEYISAANLIKDNSESEDIVYSNFNVAGMILASISGRSTANGLLPEIKPSRKFDPFAVSKIIVFAQDEDHSLINRIASGYHLIGIGENKLFILYKNPYSQARVDIKRASVPFWAIMLISAISIFLFWQRPRKIKI